MISEQAMDRLFSADCTFTIDHHKWRGWRGIEQMSKNIAELQADEDGKPVKVLDKHGSPVYTAEPNRA